jgi:ribosomal protein S12 methylthiotransferase
MLATDNQYEYNGYYAFHDQVRFYWDTKDLEAAITEFSHTGGTVEELKEFVRWARFDRMGAFAYSEEEGTPAQKQFKDEVPDEVKQRRLSELMDLQQGISAEVQAEKVGQTLKVIIDRKEGEYYVGRTEFDSPEVDPEVLIPVADGALRKGSFYNVHIVDSDDFDLYGKVKK